MKKMLLPSVLMIVAVNASADKCDYSPPSIMKAAYQEGLSTPVYFSSYQFNLPGKPRSLLSGDGFVASYPSQGYVGQQHVTSRPWSDQAEIFTSSSHAVADAYRLIYGVSSGENLNREEVEELKRQRSLLKLDCNAHVTRYLIGGSVDVIWQPSRSKDDFHTVLILGSENVELITIRLPVEEVRQVIFSIKRRM
ncbi:MULTISPECIES: hypothetical protein [unclassified Pseudomonas]|nr:MULTISPECIES: hypothetical protein [unclassified Pseudomonas]MEB0121004.1 hypothetical protein [Pseudomonas sp. CCI1.2]WPX64339.1 hypothetical protein RHM59_01200 [Pseudomonas sp. MH10]